MKHRLLRSLIASVLGLAIAPCCGQSEPTPPLPNIIIILADDLGYGDPACYNDQSKIPTPHIDRLAKEGMRFTDAHTPSSVCTPTRYGLLTGRYAWRTPLKRSVLWPWDPPLIEEDRLTLPAMLKQQGYDTACIGKWHLGWNWATKDGQRVKDQIDTHTMNAARRKTFTPRIDFTRTIEGGPTTRGFDTYFGDDVPNFPPYCFIEDDHVVTAPTMTKPDSMFGNPGPMQEGWQLDAVMPAITDRAISYIEDRAVAGDAPFFLFMTLTAPHTPIAPAHAFKGTSEAGPYGDYVNQVDATLGQVVAALNRTGLADNTLLIFTSDNGSPHRDGTNTSGPVGSIKNNYGHDPSRPWRGMKSDAWEGGHRVPFIVRWPGKTPPKTVNTDLICLTDLFRTIAAITDAPVPRGAAEDGYNILPLFRDATLNKPIRKTIVHHSGNGVFAIREGNWKLILSNRSGGFTRYTPPAEAPKGQLYNLADDPGETNNLYEQRPEIVINLTDLLDQFKSAGQSGPPD